ncbi:MAG TPA: haloacid dehalogenase type II [Terriglobales bacterium]|nr:haloacid dehalogenase type II [Terriglobales bacterium]
MPAQGAKPWVRFLARRMLNFDQFRLLTFDCYGTLIDWESGIFSALRPILARHGKTISDSDLLRLYSEFEAAGEQGEFRPYRQVLESVVKGFGERLGFTPAEPEISSLPDSLPNWLPFPDTVAALGKLKAHYQLAIISNVDDDLFAATARRLEVIFDYVITAHQARAYKPSLQIFKLAQQRTGAIPSRWLHVGQSLYHDVVPAQSLGIKTVWVNRASPRPGAGAAKTASARPDLELPDLKSLAQLTSENHELQTGS